MNDLFIARGVPSFIWSDDGSEFISRDLDLWAYQHGITLDFSRPSKPTGNSFIEALNSKFRIECLSANWLPSLADARQKIETWHRFYNEDRPYSATEYNVPNRSPNTAVHPAHRRDRARKLQHPLA